jgi:RNA polymerase-associated protein CTR9
MQCLQQVEKLSIEDLQEKKHMPKDVEIDEATMTKLREELPPQLLNNLGCFHYQAEKYDLARDLFQTALNALVKFGERDETIDTDALVTTISYNLARTYEAASLLDDAKTVYEGLLARHDDYTDARTRLAYIELRQNPTEDGPRAIAALSETDGSDLEVRALLGWYLSRSKKRATNVAEDQEQRHYKHTLQLHEKHDRYSLTGMGNAYSTYAREMRRTTDKEKEKRSAEYLKAVGYYDKALQLDPKNAYAAQGIGIALVEDKKDLTSAVQIFSKIKDTVRESSVYVNLGHVFCELKQYSRSIESVSSSRSLLEVSC